MNETINDETIKTQARPYQEELVDKAIKSNTIVYLPTGTGKTYIGVMLVKEMSHSTEKKYSEGGKRSIFLAPNVPLITQQTEYFKRNVSLKVDSYYGEKRIDDKIIDLWDESIWNKELEENQLLVMTPRILIDMIEHSFISLDRINLIIFDECHRAVGLHDYCQILRHFREFDPKGELIRILGLTACVVQTKCTLKQFNANFKKLEDEFNCKIETAIVEVDQMNVNSKAPFKKPKIKLFTFKDNREKFFQFFESLSQIVNKLQSLEQKYSKFLDKEKEKEKDFIQTDNCYKYLRKEFTDLKSVLDELGLFCFKKAFETSKETIRRKLELFTMNPDHLQAIKEFSDSIIENFEFLLSNYLPDEKEQDINAIFENSSEKIKCLMSIYKKSKQEACSQDFHSIIFVERRKTALYLSLIFQKLSECDEFSFIKSSYVFGVSNSEDKMNLNKQKVEIERFRKHEINVLVATNIVEEGFDIPNCNMVVRFSKPNNFCSFIQSKGRARSNESCFYMIVEENEFEKFTAELNDFIDIEEDINNRLIKSVNELYDENNIDDVEYLNQLIPPLRKENSELTCMKAVDLINRWINTLQRETCILYPFYKFQELKNEATNSTKFKCILWLPPNPIITKEIESDYFKRKRWAKMHAALLACKLLDDSGQLTSNLLLMTENEWLKPHIETDAVTEENSKKPTKNKIDYKIKIIDELRENHPKSNKNLHLYKIDIKETSNELIDSSFQLGFLSSKSLNEISEFKLYHVEKEFSVNLICISDSFNLNKEQLEFLELANKSIFVDMLKYSAEFDFKSSLYGGLIVILNQDDPYDDLQIDWNLMKSFRSEKENFNSYLKKNPTHDENILLRMNASKEMMTNSLVKNQANRIFSIVKIHHDMNPLSSFVKPEVKTFKEHFENKYNLETTDLEQPLVELKQVELNLNYTLKNKLTNGFKKDESKSDLTKYKERFIGEHFIVLPYERKYLFAFSLIPAIFHRIVSLLKANSLRELIENSIIQNLKIKKKKYTHNWDNSIKFNKIISLKETNSNSENETSSDEESENESIQKVILKSNNNNSNEDELINDQNVPELLIKDKLNQNELELPNTYHILQSLTLKSAHENFDLERYEILGDCFLKLVVVLRIYLKFPSTSEGNMVSLKSYRVSNNYLFKLAQNKNLQDYINSINFQPKVNWILPNEKLNENDERLKFTLKAKSLADAVEALIGCYLIHLGQKGGKAFIKWLDYKISEKDDMMDFDLENPVLPKPLLAQKPPDSSYLIEYEKFAETLNYKFNDIIYLYQAFTHPSYIKNRYTASYQKLELIGDAVLDILVTQYIFVDKKEHSPGELTSLRQSLVNNKFFAYLAVKHEFHTYMKYENSNIHTQINEYVKMHELCPPDFSYLDGRPESQNLQENDLDEYDIETPKFLADIFEAVAGAIYLDSNCSLETVWKVYYPIMKPYLIKFKSNTPVSPIVALNMLKPKSEFKPSFEEEENEVVAILKEGDQEFKAKAKTKSLAKLKVYKQAVRHYDPDRKIIFF